MIDDRDMQDWIEQTFDPDYDWLEGLEDLRKNPIPGWGYEDEQEGNMPKSELERLKRGRPDLEVQGARLDNVAETFVELDGQWYSIMINKDDLRFTTGGRSVLVSAIKVKSE